MIKLRLVSDLHVEFEKRGGGNFLTRLEPIGEDILCIAGDGGVDVWAAKDAARYGNENNIDIVYIAGNHEFYTNSNGRTMVDVYDDLTALSDDKFHFLQNQSVVIKGIRFLGCTFWTDFMLNGDLVRAMYNAKNGMNDYYKIWATNKLRFTPDIARAEHLDSFNWLSYELFSKPKFDGPTVVMTHHLPSSKSIAEIYASSEYNASYASNLDQFVANSGVNLWQHGHTHISYDYMIGSVRVVCNPRGYVPFEPNLDFNPDLVIEV